MNALTFFILLPSCGVSELQDTDVVLTQIYEVSDPVEASAISRIGVDHVGVLVGDGQFPREQPLGAAEKSQLRFFHQQSSQRCF